MTARKKVAKKNGAKKARRPVRKKRLTFSDFTLTEVLEAVVEYAHLVKTGADPIEALSGHVCRPGCIHDLADQMLRGKRELRWSLTTYDSAGAIIEDAHQPVSESLDHAIRRAEQNVRVDRATATGRGGNLCFERYVRREGILCRIM